MLILDFKKKRIGKFPLLKLYFPNIFFYILTVMMNYPFNKGFPYSILYA